MKVKTSRFGELQVEKEDIIHFKEGILGFEDLKRFFIVDPGDQTLILWFQSIDDENTAFPIIEPKIFQPNYTVKLVPNELSSLGLDNLNSATIYTILTIPQDVTEMSANLKAPIIINNTTKYARQIVLQDSKLEVRKKMYLDLKRYIVNYTSDDSKRTLSNSAPKAKSIRQTETEQETSSSPLDNDSPSTSNKPTSSQTEI